jgi:hypothetical protein
MERLRYLPTSEELRLSALTPVQRRRRELEEARLNRVYREAARILLSRGLIPSTCPMYYCYEAFAEAKRRLGPDPLIS